MKNHRVHFILILLCHFAVQSQSSKLICRQGQVSFFSYTAVENIEAINNQAVSVIDTGNGEIGVQILMRAFVFKKALMEEHFNESYVESDVYPKLTFSGSIGDFNEQLTNDTPIFIKGVMDFHGVQKEVAIKTAITKENNVVVLDGNFSTAIDDFDISVPALLVPNISKEIQVTFRFEYTPYEN